MPQSSRAPYCVVVADGARARFFWLHPTRARSGGNGVLEERVGIVNAAHRHPMASSDVPGADPRRAASGGVGRNDDASEANWRRENDRRFATQIVDQLLDCCHEWHTRSVIIVADKRTLGMLRQKTDRLGGLTIRELSRDLSRFDETALYAHLGAAGLLPVAPVQLRERHIH